MLRFGVLFVCGPMNRLGLWSCERVNRKDVNT